MKIALTSLAFTLAVATNVAAQDGGPEEHGQGQAQGPRLEVVPGPVDGPLTDVASVKVPEDFGFVGKDQMGLLNAMTGNLENPYDVGAILSKDGWLIFFNYQPVGYVNDDEKDELDADDMLTSMRENEKAANEERQKRGFPTLDLVGWQTPPYYDQATQNLTWAVKNRSGGSPNIGINHEVRLLGRQGVMSATLVAGADQFDAAVPQLGSILKGFSFNDGQRYAEYQQGDKIAEYGLTGLVLGGGALLAAKTGLLAKLGKFIKVIVVGVAVAIGGLFKFFKKRIKGEA